MRFPTAMLVAAVMLGTTMVVAPQASAVFPCDPSPLNPCCNIPPTFLYCAFDNHMFSDPSIILTSGDPSVIAGCSATGRQLQATSTQGNPAGQLVKSMGGCLALPAAVPSATTCNFADTTDPNHFVGCNPYHVNIASLGGADDNLGWILGSDAQVCFYDSSFTVIECQSGFTNDDGSSGPCIAQGQSDVAECADDSITQIAPQYDFDTTNGVWTCSVVHQVVPNGAAYFDIEAPALSVNVISAFWQDSQCLNVAV